MASNFAFSPMGASFPVTVAGTTPTTTSLTINLGITTGGYPASGVRIANLGAAVAFVQFGPSGSSVSANITTGMAILGTSVYTFSCRGQAVMSAASSGTTTFNVTPGEGL